MKRVRFHRDYETRSIVDLKKAGVHVYAEHPSTDVWCMAYCVDDGPVKLWTPGQPCPPEFIECAENPNWLAVAHNDAFEATIERMIMAEFYGWPVIPIERHRCTMVNAYAQALPGSLEMAAAALGMAERKDMDGRAVMMKMSRPRRDSKSPDGFKRDATGHLVWWDDQEHRDRLYAYCQNDVVVEREIDKRVLSLSAAELALWVVDQRINDRGIYVDLPAIDRAMQLAANEAKRLDAEMAEATGGAVQTTGQVAKLVEWVQRQGVYLSAAAKADIAAALDDPSLPDNVKRALEIRREGAKASVAKLKAMKACASSDGRMRGLLQFTVAGTRRWGGRRVQPQNLPRIETLRLPNGDPDQAAIDHILDMLGDPKWALQSV